MDAEKFGAFVAQCRREKNWTQAELAAKLQVTDKAVSRWERGRGFPDIQLLLPLANALGVSAQPPQPLPRAVLRALRVSAPVALPLSSGACLHVLVQAQAQMHSRNPLGRHSRETVRWQQVCARRCRRAHGGAS